LALGAVSRDADGVIAVVGNGMAGSRLCERLAERRVTTRRRAIVFETEPRPAYDRVRLGETLRGAPPESLTLRPRDWYLEKGIELALGRAVVSVDLQRRELACDDGSRVGFGDLVFATGSTALVPRIPGLTLPGVFTYRSMGDALAIRDAARAAGARRGAAVVLGGGVLGLEAARLIQGLGCHVLVLERAPHLLPRQLPLVASRALAERLAALGLALRVNAELRAVLDKESHLRLELAGGDCVDADLLVVAAGVRPCDGLARAAGVACHPEGGITVDDSLCASAPGVWAVGECARHAGVVPGLAAPVLRMADVAAANLDGAAERFAQSPVATRLKVEGVEVSSLGEILVSGSGIEMLVHETADATRCLVLESGRALAAAAVGPWPDWSRLQAAIERRERISARPRARFARGGRLWRGAGELPASAWPDAALVCACHGVTAGSLRAELSRGARTPAALRERTRAGTGCGSCGARVDSFAGLEVSERARPHARRLGSAAAGALALLALLLVAPPVPLAQSVSQTLWLERLWTESAARQVTGFAALAFATATLALPMRRWLPRLGGSVASWRVAHSLLGVSALSLVLVHTGLRTGRDLDRALLLSLVVLAAVGSFAALAAAFEERVPARARARLRRVTARAHALSFAPFPVLAVAHVIKVYWF